MSLSPAVRAGWCAWTRQWEGDVPWPYLDERGLVTVGLGCLVEDVAAFAALPWQRSVGAPDLSDAEAWAALRTMPPGLPAADYESATGLELSTAAIDELALARLDADVVALERTFGDLSALPDAAAQVVCSLAWAEGAGYVAHYPRFVAAIRAGDWATAAAECAISEAGNPGVRGRNVADRALLLSLVA